MERDIRPRPQLIELVSDIVSAYVAHNPVPVAELPRLIEQVHATLREVEGAPPAERITGRGKRQKKKDLKAAAASCSLEAFSQKASPSIRWGPHPKRPGSWSVGW